MQLLVEVEFTVTVFGSESEGNATSRRPNNIHKTANTMSNQFFVFMPKHYSAKTEAGYLIGEQSVVASFASRQRVVT